MSFVAGFGAELEKLAGVGGAVARFAAKHPYFTIFGALPAAMAAARSYGGRLAGGGTERVLATRVGRPSAMYYQNFSGFVPHEMAPWQKARLHWNTSPARNRLGVAPGGEAR